MCESLDSQKEIIFSSFSGSLLSRGVFCGRICLREVVQGEQGEAGEGGMKKNKNPNKAILLITRQFQLTKDRIYCGIMNGKQK